MENSTDFYYEKMKKSETPGKVIAEMYCKFYDIPMSKKEIVMCNQLVGYFGRYIVFHSVISMRGSYHDVQEDPFNLLFTIANRRFERSHNEDIIQSRQSLKEHNENLRKEIERVKKQKPKIPPAEGLSKHG